MNPVPRAAQQTADDPVATRLRPRSSRTARDPPAGSDGGGPGAGQGDEPGDQPGNSSDHDERRSEYSFESGSDAGRADPAVLDPFHGSWEPAVDEEVDEARRGDPLGGVRGGGLPPAGSAASHYLLYHAHTQDKDKTLSTTAVQP